ncbi:amidase 1 isoform X4 [Phaseolus vulgaris]|uniref:amidase 1 isoform X4 n=1 Tax=Phaseolus vulgaris TaxID=3885 RepID=UPI0035CC758E
METASGDYGAFMEKFTLPPKSAQDLPLNSLTFAIKEIFDVEGYVTGMGNPDWARTHPVATSTAPTVLALLGAGATCVGKTVMDEMAYSINGENIHYGTPRNPCAPDRVPGGSSSGSAVAVGAKLVDFSLGTDTGGSVRVPASYCGIFGFRPSHGAISVSGVIPMAQSFDTVGDVLKQEILGDYVKTNVPSLKHFMSKETTDQIYNIPSLSALSSAMRLLQRYEFKNNHGEWITAVKPDFGPGISERVLDALRTTGENIDTCYSVKRELHDALAALLGDFGVLMIPTVPGPPPKLQTNSSELEIFRARAFSLLSIAGVSGFCQVSIPLGMYNNLPLSISLVARHGADRFLLHLVESLYASIKEQKAA